ncbi:MAG: Mut7-C RNAse domain-containing protein [Thermoplasmatales archaeon]|nr:Mut7-C RNAse domain-containing protein [Thermoplasmatales archaeon]MCK5636777.1 Mut7-C RNAse domain-containing protein [Thermoplasmatales archaeon]
MKFLCDQMLGTLAKWLRIYGFDTFYASRDMDDPEVLEISKKENRILISRDKNLIIAARRENLKTIEISTTDLDEQISIVLGNIKPDKTKILSRCIICNAKVEDIKKQNVEDKVPEKVFKNKEKFWLCKNCNKIYWQGSHYEKMFEKIDNLG